MRSPLLIVIALAGCAGDPTSVDGGHPDRAQVVVEEDLAPDAVDLAVSGCANGVMDGDESDVDCGGSCGDCEDGKQCVADDDCKSSYCGAGRCGPRPTCNDGAKNQDESDVDCGGRCPACPALRHCNRGDDCLSRHCKAGQCIVPVASVMGFAPAVEYPMMAGDAYGVTVGDFDGDKKLDVAATTDGASSLVVMLGNGDGTLQAPKTYAPNGQAQFGVASADLDADGRSDIVIANTSDDNVNVFFGRAQGLSAPIMLPAPDQVASVAIADVNGDGRLDIAAAATGLPGGSVYLNMANGFFAGPTFAGGINGVHGLAALDLDGDGKADVIQLGNPTVFAGATMGALKELWSNQEANYVRLVLALGHLNGDGRVDLVVGAAGPIETYLGDGKGAFAMKTTPFKNLPAEVACADFDGDGWDDVIAVGFAGAASVFLGHNDGTFDPEVNLQLGAGLRGLAVADLNRDGRPDLIASVSGTDSVVVRLNTTR